jgi:hypothetical protein
MVEVMVQGEGAGAFCSARLLNAAGVYVRLERAEQVRVPAIMLGEAAQALICDVFENNGLFTGLHRIEKRVVAWGRDADPIALPHSSVVISGQELSDRLCPTLPDRDRHEPETRVWTIYCSRPLPPGSIEHNFGTRIARASAVELKHPSNSGSCWIESLESGWLFLVPTSEKSGWLLSVGGPTDDLLGGSRLIVEQIEPLDRSGGEFPAYPRIAAPMCGPGWLACGTAAMGFDPLCGDGTAHAVREAILAAAVIRASEREPSENILAHYRTRLLAGFKRHLELCREFYQRGWSGPWWDAELHHIRVGIAWCEAELGAEPDFRYQLNGFELRRIPAMPRENR